MNELSFTEEDKQKFVEFLNTVAKNATFQLKTEDIISYFKLLAHMQQSILIKINANILEVVRITENKEKPSEVKETKTTKSK